MLSKPIGTQTMPPWTPDDNEKLKHFGLAFLVRGFAFLLSFLLCPIVLLEMRIFTLTLCIDSPYDFSF